MKRLALTIFGTVLIGTLLAVSVDYFVTAVPMSLGSGKTAALAAIYAAVAVALWKLTSKLDG